jgi:hypothetical protein
MANKKVAGLLGCVMMGVAIGTSAAAPKGEFSFSLGAEYTTGNYDSGSDTDIFYFPATFYFDADRFRVSITAPLIWVDGPGNVVGGGEARGIYGPGGSNDGEFGIGDLMLRGSINLQPESRDMPRVDLTGALKFGTADRDDNLGTGEDDFSVQVDLERNFSAVGAFGSLGYRVMGDPPGVRYKNPLFGQVGFAYRAGSGASVGAAYNFQQRVLSGTPGQGDITFFMTAEADAKTQLTGFVLKGVRDGSPDWGLGFQVKFFQ